MGGFESYRVVAYVHPVICLNARARRRSKISTIILRERARQKAKGSSGQSRVSQSLILFKQTHSNKQTHSIEI